MHAHSLTPAGCQHRLPTELLASFSGEFQPLCALAPLIIEDLLEHVVLVVGYVVDRVPRDDQKTGYWPHHPGGVEIEAQLENKKQCSAHHTGHQLGEVHPPLLFELFLQLLILRRQRLRGGGVVRQVVEKQIQLPTCARYRGLTCAFFELSHIQVTVCEQCAQPVQRVRTLGVAHADFVYYRSQLALALAATCSIAIMADGNEYTIGEAAEALGVSTKALRHWETRGLLEPTRSWADHRIYTDVDLERGAAIALYRGVGVPLAQIATLIDASGATLARALTHHQEALASRRRTLDAQLASVQHLIDNATKGSIDMDAMKKYLGENMPAYQAEAEQRWGDTPEWAQSQEKLAQMGEGDFQRLQEEQDALAADLVNARDAGVAPGSEEAEALVERHRASIAQWYDVTPARQLILARMYVGDPRFHEAYHGAQEFLLELVTAHAKAEGVDVDNPRWG